MNFTKTKKQNKTTLDTTKRHPKPIPQWRVLLLRVGQS